MFKLPKTARISTSTTKKDQESGPTGLRKAGDSSETGNNTLIEVKFDINQKGTAAYCTDNYSFDITHHEDNTTTVIINGKEFKNLDYGYYEYNDPEDPDHRYWIRVFPCF